MLLEESTDESGSNMGWLFNYTGISIIKNWSLQVCHAFRFIILNNYSARNKKF